MRPIFFFSKVGNLHVFKMSTELGARYSERKKKIMEFNVFLTRYWTAY